MTAPFPRRATPRRTFAALASAMALAGGLALPPALAAVDNSALDAQLFYQLLIGEIQLRSGEAVVAYEVVLDAARRNKSEELFRRAADIALQARSGDQALAAARAWRQALPQSLEAHRYLVQLLVATNRTPEAQEPLRSLVNLVPAGERAAAIATLPRFFARVGDRAQAAQMLEQALQPFADAPATRGAVALATGRAWLAAPDPAKALEIVRRAHAADPVDEGPVIVAVEMLPSAPEAEALITSHLKARPDSHGIRLGYVRALTGAQRFVDAIAQLEVVTRSAPNLAPPWLTLGALQLELRHPAEATSALQTYLKLMESNAAKGRAAPASEPEIGAEDDNDPPENDQTQAWLMLAQAAEQRNDYAAAESWLAKVDSPQRALEVQSRRAALLARQGKVAQARELIRKLPEPSAAEARAKLLAEAQVLRDVKQWREAYAVLAQANQRYPDDVELLYEQSMVAEKLDRLDEMERLLRKVIAIKPDHHHAYNALGYSLADRNQRLPEARSLIRKALELSPGEPFITDSLGWVEFRLGNREEAIRLLRAAYQSRPDVEIAAHLGEVLWVAGQRDEARKVWRDATGRDASNEVLRATLARLRVDL